EFYEFYRSLSAYRSSFHGKDDVLLLKPDSDFFKYFNDPSRR
ncbi:MAG: protease modulator HflC, partial [Gammaproteobacteria bacterium]